MPISFGLIERLRARYPSVFVGIKDSAGDLSNMEALVERFPGFAVLAGADPLMLPLLRKGGAGAITATTNLVARDLAFVFRHFADPGRAAEVEAAQARVVAARNRASRFAQMPSLKVLLRRSHRRPGLVARAAPAGPSTEEERSALLGVEGAGSQPADLLRFTGPVPSDLNPGSRTRATNARQPPREGMSMQEFTGAESTLIVAMIVGYIVFTVLAHC